MQIQPTAASAASQASQTSNEDKASQTKAEEEFQTFLQLLTAQMRHQDPLEPLDSTQFVAQLAAFSSVEQQITTNEKLDNLYDFLTTAEFLVTPDDGSATSV